MSSRIDRELSFFLVPSVTIKHNTWVNSVQQVFSMIIVLAKFPKCLSTWKNTPWPKSNVRMKFCCRIMLHFLGHATMQDAEYIHIYVLLCRINKGLINEMINYTCAQNDGTLSLAQFLWLDQKFHQSAREQSC